MPGIKVYRISIWTKGGNLAASLIIEGNNRDQAERVAMELKYALIPILSRHYESIGFKEVNFLRSEISIQ